MVASCSLKKFQFTHPGGVRRSHLFRYNIKPRFNSRTREGCDLSMASPFTRLMSFNSRTREGCDGNVSLHCVNSLHVSIHAPGRGATARVGGCMPLTGSFNSRTREGCDKLFYTAVPMGGVSIHAPGRGATQALRLFHRVHRGFNSRTREGCDSYQAIMSKVCPSFNSRTREGCDQKYQYQNPNLQGFNSRTREGCDDSNLKTVTEHIKFQFTHPGGVRLRRSIRASFSSWFQFTHPGGVRRRGHNASWTLSGFNSRTREGCDCSQQWQSGRPPCFNSRTREGCDGIEVAGYIHTDVSIHAPGRGATSLGVGGAFSRKSFNSRTREGCDSYSCFKECHSIQFQFTHPGGVRHRPR